MEELWLTTWDVWDVENPVHNGIFSHMLLKPDDMTILRWRYCPRVAWPEESIENFVQQMGMFLEMVGAQVSRKLTYNYVAPESWWLEYYFAFWNGIFSGAMKVFLGEFLERNVGSATVVILTCALFTLLQPFS